MDLALSMDLGLQQGGGGASLSTLAQLAASSAVLGLHDWTDTTSVFRSNGFGAPVQGSSHPIHGVASLAGMSGIGSTYSDFASWAAAQPNEASAGTWIKGGSEPTHVDLLSDTSVRWLRSSISANRAEWVPPSFGWWYIEGDISDYDGAATPYTALEGYFSDSFANSEYILPGASGSFKAIRPIFTKLTFSTGNPDRGARIDNFKAVKLPDYCHWQPTSADRPVYNNGPVFDGSTDCFFLPRIAADTALSLVAIVKPISPVPTGNKDILREVSLFRYVSMQSGSTAVAVGQFTVDQYLVGATDATAFNRDALYQELSDGVARVHTLDNLSNFADSTLTWGRMPTQGGQAWTGHILPIATLDPTDPDHDAMLAVAQAEAARQLTELGL